MKFCTTFYDNEKGQMRVETWIAFSSQDADALPCEIQADIKINVPILDGSGNYIQLRGDRHFSDFYTIQRQQIWFWLKEIRHIEIIRNNIDLRKRIADKIHEELQAYFERAMEEEKKLEFKPIGDSIEYSPT